MANSSIPDKDAIGVDANMKSITFMLNYQQFLSKAPSWLATFEAATEDVLCFLHSMITDSDDSQEKLNKYIAWTVNEEEFYKNQYTEVHGKILHTYVSNNVPTEMLSSSGQTSSSQQSQGNTESKYKARPDLVPNLLPKSCTPFEFASWREKFEYWVATTWGQVQEDSKLLGNKLKQKLESDWISILKSNLEARFNNVTYEK